jgi:hypothetical protein
VSVRNEGKYRGIDIPDGMLKACMNCKAGEYTPISETMILSVLWNSSIRYVLPEALAISLYFAGVSRYPLYKARVVSDRLGSTKAGCQPRFLEVGAKSGV